MVPRRAWGEERPGIPFTNLTRQTTRWYYPAHLKAFRAGFDGSRILAKHDGARGAKFGPGGNSSDDEIQASDSDRQVRFTQEFPLRPGEFARTLVVQAPAKLNLFLEILGKRTDGYHELETLMVTVNLYDTLSFTEEDSEEIRLRMIDAGRRRPSDRSAAETIPGGPDNLVVRAAFLLREFTGVKRGARITLFKRIPAAAGLAGGSSDAAATLVALNRLWQLNLAPRDLHELAQRLGSDVAFFVTGRSAAICRGRGEIVEPVALPLGLHFVVARPRTGLSTAEVYRRCQPGAIRKNAEGLVAALRSGQLKKAGRCFHNALEAPARELNADIEQLRSCFERLPVIGHQMSGSGSAYFGLCTNRRTSRKAASRLRGARVGGVWEVQSRH